MRKLIIFLSVFVIASLLPTIILADPVPIAQPIVTLSPIEYADKYTIQYGVDSNIFKKVMYCESKNNPNPPGYNDGGKAYGVMQFHKQTFDTYSKKLGEELDYYSAQDQIKLAAYMFSINQQKHWTCYTKIVG